MVEASPPIEALRSGRSMSKQPFDACGRSMRRATKRGPMSDTVFRDPSRPLAVRVEDLLARLTLAEKLALLHQYQPAVPRLGIAPFRTGTEALHGLAWLGEATVFPQAIGLATSWNPDLLTEVGAAVGDEVRPHRPTRSGQRLGAGGQPVARPPLGAQRGGLLGGPVADRLCWPRRTRGAWRHPDAATARRSSTSWPTTTRPTGTSRRATSPRECCTSTTCRRSASRSRPAPRPP